MLLYQDSAWDIKLATSDKWDSQTFEVAENKSGLAVTAFVNPQWRIYYDS
jgi:hypothetical protein